MKNKSAFIIAFTLLSLFANGQAPAWTWIKEAGGTEPYNTGLSVCADAYGHVNSTGYFTDPTITFGNITLTNAAHATGSTYSDMFVTKYDTSGNIIWAKTSGGAGSSYATAVSTDGAGNVYVTGYFYGDTTTFGNITLINTGIGTDMFLVKYDSTGNIIWAKCASGEDVQAFGVANDAEGNTYVTGNYSWESVTFDTITLDDRNEYNMFLVKYDPMGNVIWVIMNGGPQMVSSNATSVDAGGNIFITGFFNTIYVVFGPDTLFNTYNIDHNSVFTVKFDPSGNVIWAKNSVASGYGAASVAPNAIATDARGNCFITGFSFDSSISFGNYTLYNELYFGSYGSILFLVKYDPSGNILWVSGFSPLFESMSCGLCTDAQGNVYTTGYLQEDGNAFDDLFVTKYGVAGDTIWTKTAKRINLGSEIGQGISADSRGNLYLTGSIENDAGFDSVTVGTLGKQGIFTARINSHRVLRDSVYYTICQGQYYEGFIFTGIYIDTLTSSTGDDSIRTLFLTVLPPARDTVTARICLGHSYGGHDTSGTYIDTLTASTGCDSIRTLYLIISTPIRDTVTQYICLGHSFDGYSLPGTYNDTFIAAGGCDSIRTVNLFISSPIRDSITEIVCSGFTYYPYNTSGTYVDIFTATGGCDSIRTLFLTVLPYPTNIEKFQICQGDIVHGHNTTGSFVDTVITAGACDSIITFEINVNPIPDAPVITRNGDTLFSTPAFQYQWFYEGNILPGDTNISLVVDNMGGYVVQATDTQGCSKQSDLFVTDGITNVNAIPGLAIYPNPTNDMVHIAFSKFLFSQNYLLRVYDITGRLIHTQTLDKPGTTLNISAWAGGLYVFKINNEQGAQAITRVVKD